MDRNFYCEMIPDEGVEAALSEAESQHLRTVLRGSVGESIGLLNGRGTTARATIVDSGGKREPVRCRVDSRIEHSRPALRPVLYVAPPRGKTMVSVVRHATELAVSRISPLLTSRTVSQPDVGAVSGWKRQALEACKQSGNPFVPEIAAPLRFADALAERLPGYTGCPAHGARPHPAERLASDRLRQSGGQVGLWIGPEGGFTDDESQQLAEFTYSLTVGPWVLRLETAVVACLGWLQGTYVE